MDSKRIDQIRRRAEQGDPVVGVGDTITNGELLELLEQFYSVERRRAQVCDAFDKIAAANTVTICSLSEMESIVNRALDGEFDICAG